MFRFVPFGSFGILSRVSSLVSWPPSHHLWPPSLSPFPFLHPLCASFSQLVYPNHQRAVGGFVCARVTVCVRAALFHGLSESSAISCIVLPLIEAKSGPLSGIAVCSPVCLCVSVCAHTDKRLFGCVSRTWCSLGSQISQYCIVALCLFGEAPQLQEDPL